MPHAATGARLRFRRHLFVCAVALVAYELASLGDVWQRQQQQSADGQPRRLGASRVRQATAAELSATLGNAAFDSDVAAVQQPRRLAARSTDKSVGTPATADESSAEMGVFAARDAEALRDSQAGGAQHGWPFWSTKQPDSEDADLDTIDWTRDSLSSLLSRLVRPFVPTLWLNFTIIQKHHPDHQLDTDVENYYKQRFATNMTLDELHLLAVKAALRVAPMPIHTTWGYASRDELRQSAWPVYDEARCTAHLSHLAARLERVLTRAVSPIVPLPPQPLQSAKAVVAGASPVDNFEARQVYSSTELQFARYMDTFGHVPHDVLAGNVRWYGSSAGCLDSRLLMPAAAHNRARRIRFRYCMAALKSFGWHDSYDKRQHDRDAYEFGVHTHDVQSDSYFVRVGVCLPESCDSRALERPDNARHLDKLVKFNLMRPFNSDHYYLSDLYCVPDERSPLRAVPLMGKLLLVASLGWLALIGGATVVHLNVERFYAKAVHELRQKKLGIDESRSSPSGARQQQDVVPKQSEFGEADVLGLKRTWVRLNVFVWDTSKRLVGGVDLIECLSLYSNWLRYTRHVKRAIAEQHADEQRHERIKRRHYKLVDNARAAAAAATTIQRTESEPNMVATSASPAKNVSNSKLASITGSRAELNNSAAWFNRELGARLKLQDDCDEHEWLERKQRVDTSSLNALKVMALAWIIAGHCILYLGSTVSNSAMSMQYVRDLAAFALANGAMYITELFFVITGCLATYLAFKSNTYVAHARDVVVHRNGAHTCRDTKLSIETADEQDNAAGQDKQWPQQQVACMESRMFRAPFWLVIILNRYLRMLPTFLFVYSFVRLVSVYVSGSGQLWDYAVSPNSVRRVCTHESWWPVVTFTENLHDIYGHCLLGTWYLSADMQLMVMSVPLLILLALCQRQHRSAGGGSHLFGAAGRQQQQHQMQELNTTATAAAAEQAANDQKQHQQQQPEAELQFNNIAGQRNEIATNTRLAYGYAIIVALALLSALASMIYGFFESQVDLSLILRFVPHSVSVLSRNIALYTNSLFRFRAYGFGLCLGHLLYLYEFRLIRMPKMIQQHGSKLATITFSAGFLAMFMPVIYPKDKLIISHDMVVVCMIATACAVDVFLCALIFLTCIGKAPKPVLFVLNSPFWTLLSSLSLCAFLVHTEVIIVLTSQLNPPPSVSYSLAVLVLCATLVFTYALAFCVHLALELPVSRLIDSFMRKHLSGSRAAKSDKPQQ